MEENAYLCTIKLKTSTIMMSFGLFYERNKEKIENALIDYKGKKRKIVFGYGGWGCGCSNVYALTETLEDAFYQAQKTGNHPLGFCNVYIIPIGMGDFIHNATKITIYNLPEERN